MIVTMALGRSYHSRLWRMDMVLLTDRLAARLSRKHCGLSGATTLQVSGDFTTYLRSFTDFNSSTRGLDRYRQFKHVNIHRLQ